MKLRKLVVIILCMASLSTLTYCSKKTESESTESKAERRERSKKDKEDKKDKTDNLEVNEGNKDFVGTWKSYEVTDAIGDDASSTQDPKGVVLEFAADTVRITYNGEKLPKLKWDSLEDIGVIMEDDETYKDLGFELDGDELKFYYDVGDDYYIYKCTKK